MRTIPSHLFVVVDKRDEDQDGFSKQVGSPSYQEYRFYETADGAERAIKQYPANVRERLAVQRLQLFRVRGGVS